MQQQLTLLALVLRQCKTQSATERAQKALLGAYSHPL